MADQGDVRSATNDQVKNVKRVLEGWREILLPVNSALQWDKPYAPGILAGTVTFLYLLVWYLEPSLLTSLSLLGMVLCLADYLVPLLSPKIFDPNKWGGAEEKKFEEFCQSLTCTIFCCKHSLSSFMKLKKNNPKMFFILAIVGLSLSAWIGNLIDNLFLTYLGSLVLVMLPGLKRHGILEKHVGQAIVALQKMMGKTKTN